MGMTLLGNATRKGGYKTWELDMKMGNIGIGLVGGGKSVGILNTTNSVEVGYTLRFSINSMVGLMAPRTIKG